MNISTKDVVKVIFNGTEIDKVKFNGQIVFSKPSRSNFADTKSQINNTDK